MTLSNTQLRETIINLTVKGAMSAEDHFEMIDQLVALFTTAQQQLLSELKEHKREFKVPDWQTSDDSGLVEAVPVSVINNLMKGLQP